MTESSKFWKVVTPDRWPSPPERFSYSNATELEACARRWSLSHADYSSSIGRSGYPQRPRKATLLGQVSHMALQAITDSLQAVGCMGPQDPGVVLALKGLGGISRVVERQGEDLLDQLATNPRAEPIMDRLRLDLHRGLPAIRQVVQGSLQRIFGISETPNGREKHPSGMGRQPLQSGFHSEVMLAPAALPWVGWADAIKLSSEACEILDYKTGGEDPRHVEQLRIYALLWARDEQLNPHGRLATHLTIVYSGTTRPVEIPDTAALTNLERELRSRESAVKRTLTTEPPPASVSADNCRYCAVKHLCHDHWTQDARQFLQDGEASLRSLQIEIIKAVGIRSWEAVVEVDPYLEAGRQVLVLTHKPMSLQKGMKLRLIDARVDSAEEPALVHLFSTSELYVLPGP